MSATSEQHNNVKWSGFFLTEEAAQKALDAMVKAEKKNSQIISVKKELQLKKKDAYLLYKFTIIKRPFNK
jgi:hypothetical protein